MTKAEELAGLAKGEGCLARSQDDEPIFVLCARDRFAADAVRDWADSVEVYAAARGELDGARKAKIADARKVAAAMDRWPEKKLPG